MVVFSSGTNGKTLDDYEDNEGGGLSSFACHIASMCFGSESDAQEITETVLNHIATFMEPPMDRDISIIAASCKSLCIANSNHSRRRALICEPCSCKEASISPRAEKTVSLVLRRGMSPKDTHEHLQSLMSEQNVELMGPILSMMMVHRENKGIFDRPVDYVALNLPDYPIIVKHPMDLGTVRKRLHEGKYCSLDTFADDIRLVFRNAMTFNHHTHPIYKKASAMLSSFEGILHKTKKKIEISRKEMAAHQCDMCDSGSVCPLCLLKCRKLASPVLSCARCDSRVPVRSSFYCLKGTKKVWCPKCFGMHGKPEMFDGAGGGPQKYRSDSVCTNDGSMSLKMRKVYNGTKCTEAWISCVRCDARYHQACVLHNPWENNTEFVCLSCRSGSSKQFSSLPRAKDLPRTNLVDAIETRLRDEIKNYNDTFCLREVSRRDQVSKLPESFLQSVRVASPSSCYPSNIKSNSRVLHLYQRIDGVDVLLFAMYVSEFGKDAPVANRMSSYISYLDSIHFMRPRHLRTKMYHTILCAYIADAKSRGFTNCHIWACPPLRTAEYIFHKHPRSQRTPGWERLRKWYDEMIRKAHSEGSIVQVGTLYKDHFSLPVESRDRQGVSAPYFPKHFWIEQLELAVHSSSNPISTGPVCRRLRSGSDSISSNITTPPPKKKRRRVQNLLSKEFARRLSPMAERLLVLRLQPMCSGCGQYVSQDDEIVYRCTGTCCTESNHGRRRKSSLSVKQADLWTGGSTSSPVISAKHLIPSCAYFCRSCCTGTNKHKLARRNNHDGPLRAVKLVSKKNSNTQYFISNPIVDDRLTFLAFCGGNHLQFDTLRHAKYSSMLILHMLFQNHKNAVKSFVRYCNVCRMPIVNGDRWQCDMCPSFDLCSSCVSQHKTSSHSHEVHEHPLRCVKVTNAPFQARLNQ